MRSSEKTMMSIGNAIFQSTINKATIEIIIKNRYILVFTYFPPLLSEPHHQVRNE